MNPGARHAREPWRFEFTSDTPESWTAVEVCSSTHYCAGCDAMIPPGREHLEHFRKAEGGVLELLIECLDCAKRNGRPEVSDPDVPEQPLDLGGIA